VLPVWRGAAAFTVLLAVLACADSEDTAEYVETASAAFAVKFKDEVSPYPVMALFAMPGDTVPLEVVLSDTVARYTAHAGDGRLERIGSASWRWIAPREKGVSAIVVRDCMARLQHAHHRRHVARGCDESDYANGAGEPARAL
jgi:hypothetical protein